MTATIEEFTRWLKLGLGRAVLYLQKHDATPYRDVILDACLHNRAYDTQIEGGRAMYMFDMISLTNEKDFYREHILKALADNSVELDRQVDDLALCFAQQGDVEARQLLYDHFVENSAKTHLDAGALIKLDGLAGFAFVVHQIGGRVMGDDDIWEDHYVLGFLEERLGKENYQTAIAQLSNEGALVKTYVEAIEAYEAQRASRQSIQPDVKQASYVDFRTALLEKQELSRYPVLWGQSASEVDLRQAAEDLLMEKDRRRLLIYLRIFHKRPFPLAPDYLLKLAQNSDDWVAGRAFGVLSRITHPTVRALAFRLLDEPAPKWKGQIVELLVRNYHDGDHTVVEELVASLKDDGERHSLGMDVRDFYEAHPNAESEARVTKAMYETNPCARCRCGFVSRLVELSVLPNWMAEECAWDSNENTRELMKDVLLKKTDNQQPLAV
ncbi:MAG: hypothetical protein JNL09_03485 [Anaerolineales bacterium]|nr:hypothetical protein [Anaerolineales bacterium]